MRTPPGPGGIDECGLCADDEGIAEVEFIGPGLAVEESLTFENQAADFTDVAGLRGGGERGVIDIDQSFELALRLDYPFSDGVVEACEAEVRQGLRQRARREEHEKRCDSNGGSV